MSKNTSAPTLLYGHEVDYLKNWYTTVKIDPKATGTLLTYTTHGVVVEGVAGANGLFTVVKINR
jgi:hypothetical protein